MPPPQHGRSERSPATTRGAQSEADFPNSARTLVILADCSVETPIAGALARSGHDVTLLSPAFTSEARTRAEANGVKVSAFPHRVLAECDAILVLAETYDAMAWALTYGALLEGRTILDLSRLSEAPNHAIAPSMFELLTRRFNSARIARAQSLASWEALTAGTTNEVVYLCGDPTAKSLAKMLFEGLGLDTEDLGGARAAPILATLGWLRAPYGNTRMLIPETHDHEVLECGAHDEEVRAVYDSHLQVGVTHGSSAQGIGGNGWATVTLKIGHFSIELEASDCADTDAATVLRKLAGAIKRDELPIREQIDEEGPVMSIGVRRTTAPDFVYLVVGNLHDTHFEALVRRDQLVGVLESAAGMLGGDWRRRG